LVAVEFGQDDQANHITGCHIESHTEREGIEPVGQISRIDHSVILSHFDANSIATGRVSVGQCTADGQLPTAPHGITE
jgi:hypothetical protein